MTTNPIAGNQFFTRVNNAAGQLPEQNVSNSNAVSLRAAGVATNGLFINALPAQVGKTLRSVTGFAPSSLVGGGAANFFLNNAAGVAAQATPSSTNTAVMTIPAGALITSVLLGPDATFVGGTLAAGTQALTGAVPGANVNLCAASLAVSVNAGASVGQIAPAALTGVAIPTGTTVAVAASPTVTGVTITTSANITASSGLQVTVYYLI
jgi:hypothetical protein